MYACVYICDYACMCTSVYMCVYMGVHVCMCVLVGMSAYVRNDCIDIQMQL